MENRNIDKEAIKSGGWYTVSSILIKSSSILTAPIFTRLLKVEEFGIVSSFMAWLGLVSVFTGLGITYSIGNARVEFPKFFDQYIASIQVLVNILAVFALLLVSIFVEPVALFFNLDQNLILLMFTYLIFFPSILYTQEKNKFYFYYKQNIIISLISTIGAVTMSFIFIYFFDDTRYVGRILGLIIPMLFMGMYFNIRILKRGWSAKIFSYWKYALKIGIPMVPHALAMIVLAQMDRLMIIKMRNSAEAGLYSFGYTYALLLAMFGNAVIQAYKPWLFIKYKMKESKAISKSNALITLSFCIITISLIAVSPEALKILGPRDYWPANIIVAPVALGTLFQLMYSNYVGIEMYHKKSFLVACGSTLAALVNYGLNMIFIPKYGFVAAAYTTLVSYFVLALFHLMGYRRIVILKIFNDKLIWTMLGITSLISMAVPLLYDELLYRYLFVVFLLISVAIIKKDDFYKFINQFR